MQPQPLGLLGLGLLGGALAQRFLMAGFQIVGYDPDPRCCATLAALGGKPAASAREVARQGSRLVFSLPSTPVVEAVLQEIAPELHAGSRIVDTTTGDPERTALLGADLARKGVHYLDATISGSSEQVRSGDIVVMVGGEAAAAAACADLFACFSKQWFHVGGWGAGARMKLVVNLVLGLNRAVLAEGLSLALACGLDAVETLRILQASAAYSRVMDTKGRKMIERDFTPQARLGQHLKDVYLILAEAERVQAKVPLSALHRILLEQVQNAGGGEDDNCGILRAFDAK
jgi:3-hydroxyisobutyrate dehydrogenase-like beta-hydroxyacid dehydrogenase